jgi:hypothetical protein
MRRRFLVVALLVLAALTLGGVIGCGIPVEPRAVCRGAEVTNAADSTGTKALGSVYAHVYCDGVIYTDTIR